MSLFQKKTVDHSLNYSLNSKTNLLIVGLGNIGKEYGLTRHNIGFECINAIHDNHNEFEPWKIKKDSTRPVYEQYSMLVNWSCSKNIYEV